MFLSCVTEFVCSNGDHSDRHAAVTIKNLDPLIESLERHKVYYSFSKSGRRSLFIRDLDANALEFVEDPTL
jgi:glyoxylase I family protein